MWENAPLRSFRAPSRWAFVGALLFASLASREARAASTGDGSSVVADVPMWRYAVAAGTEFPMSVALRGQVEAPFRLRLSSAVGVLPGPYVSAINGILVGVGAYNQATADLIRDALGSSLIWRTHLGYRPFVRHGFTFEAGYGLVALGGGASASTIVSAATGASSPEAGTDKNFKVSSALHMVDVELGWEWVLLEHLFVRAAAGGAFTLAASSSVTPDYTPRAPRVTEAFGASSAAYLDETYTTYVFTPVVSLWAGYSF